MSRTGLLGLGAKRNILQCSEAGGHQGKSFPARSDNELEAEASYMGPRVLGPPITASYIGFYKVIIVDII